MTNARGATTVTRACPPGKWSTVERCRCSQCRAGFYGITAGSANPECTAPCKAGRYSVGGSSNVHCDGACLAGHYGIGGSTSAGCDGACRPGKYSLAGASSCITCPRGYFYSRTLQSRRLNEAQDKENSNHWNIDLSHFTKVPPRIVIPQAQRSSVSNAPTPLFVINQFADGTQLPPAACTACPLGK